jgi:hypothetical protein
LFLRIGTLALTPVIEKAHAHWIMFNKRIRAKRCREITVAKRIAVAYQKSVAPNSFRSASLKAMVCVKAFRQRGRRDAQTSIDGNKPETG